MADGLVAALVSSALVCCSGAEGRADASYVSLLPTDPPSMAIRVPGRNLLGVAPLEKVQVAREEHKGWGKDLSPNLVMGPVDTFNRLNETLDPATVDVRSRDGTGYEEGKDYKLDRFTGGLTRLDEGGVKAGDSVELDYTVSLQRMDTVQISPDGDVSLKRGMPAIICPVAPPTDPGHRRLANIFLPYHTESIQRDNIFPVEGPALTWRSFLRIEGKEHLRRTRKLLQQDKHVTIVCFGDSVTYGYSASSPGVSFPGLLDAELKTRFPHAKVTVVREGEPGANSSTRLVDLDKAVLAHHPDLVITEFVGDASITPNVASASYAEMFRRIRNQNPNADILMLTPNPPADALQDTIAGIARANQAGLGDAANIWRNLHRLGIPWKTLLANGINHPNDLGHRFYVEAILLFFR